MPITFIRKKCQKCGKTLVTKEGSPGNIKVCPYCATPYKPGDVSES